jgi:hypothetical protein
MSDRATADAPHTSSRSGRGQRGGGRVGVCHRADANVRRRVPHAARSSRPQPSRSPTTSRRRAPRGRVHRVLPPRPAPRAVRPRPSRSSTTSLSALRSAAALADFHRAPLCRAPLCRSPRAPPPRRSHAFLAAVARAFFHHVALTRFSRPLTGRSSTAPLCASWSAAFHAFFHRVALRVPVGRCPCARRRRLPRRAVVAAGAPRTPSVPSRRATGLRAIHARGRACRNRLDRSGLGDSTGRAGSLRAGRAA